MPIRPPDLDDMQFATMRDLLVRQIPVFAPDWTNHNDADPGIALLQLFASLAEQIGFRLNRLPEKNYLEFLKLIGVRLRPAQAASTVLAFALATPETQTAFLIAKGSRVLGVGGDEPPVFETDVDLDAVPAQLGALVTTSSNDLRQVRGLESEPGVTVDPADFVKQRFTLAWNGKAPKLKDMPAEPVPVFAAVTTPAQKHLWIGLVFNPVRSAGFVGQRVTLTVQLDDDEQPFSVDGNGLRRPATQVTCATEETELFDPTAAAGPQVFYQYYRPRESATPAPAAPTVTTSGTAGAAVWRYRIVGVLADGSLTPASTEGSIATGNATLNGANRNVITWTDPPGATAVRVYRTVSGGSPVTTGRFAADVAKGTQTLDDVGAPGDGTTPPTGSWQELLPLTDTTDAWTRSGQIRFDVPQTIGPIPDDEWQPVRAPQPKTTAAICAEAAAGGVSTLPPPLPHPLPGAIKTPVDGLTLSVPISGWIHVAFPNAVPSFSVRSIGFNVAPATNAETVRAEQLGLGSGKTDQVMTLAEGNILAGTLELAVSDLTDGQLHLWREVPDFDAAGPNDRVYVLDPEAGEITFGDGRRGRPPEEQARVVALSYRHGGGTAAELRVGTINKPESLPSQVQDAFSIVDARGGRDAETLEEAKRRAPKQLAVSGRAVTRSDFAFLAEQTPGVRVARAEVVPLRTPIADVTVDGPGLALDRVVPGALSVIVVPTLPGPYPTPTTGELRKVCQYLDRFRLVTTEVHVAPPMYVRIFDLAVKVKARPGFTRTALRETIASRLETYFHVLTGGAEGTGFPFGATIHHADLVAQVFQVPGIERVEELEAFVDGMAPTPKGDPTPMVWRKERLPKRRLTNCMVQAGDVVRIDLAADENVFIDATTLEVIVV